MTIALCGAPNCGKTTLFNRLTGESRRTGNWPGVTVQLGEGILSAAYSSSPVRIVDLPGALSLRPFSPDEAVLSQYLTVCKPDAVIVVIDSCSPAQGLYLALQLQELHLPLLLAFNMSDRLRSIGGSIHLSALSRALHLPCLSVSARKSTNLQALIHTAIHTATPSSSAIPPLDPAARWKKVDQLINQFFSFPDSSAIHPLDRLALHPFFAWPLLFSVFALLFYIIFGAPGQLLSAAFSSFFDSAVTAIDPLLSHSSAALRTILDGLLRSMASVLSFLPVLLLFFFFTALLEDSGYLSRAAFLLDAPLKRLGLSGRSFFPLITGLSCSVPAILSTQSLPSAKERTLTARLIPLIPCSAKMPVLLFLITRCLGAQAFPFMLLCFSLCLLCAVLFAALIKESSAAPPLLSELPAYHLPSINSACKLMRQKASDFLIRACTLIFLTGAIIRLLQSFTPTLRYTASIENSLLFSLSRFFIPLLSPLGFASPLTVAALIAGVLAKENILSVLVICPPESLFPTPAAALSFLVFSLLYSPCVASCGALAQALKSRKRMLFSVLLQTLLAWLAAFFIYQLFS